MRYILLILAFLASAYAQPLTLGKSTEETEHSAWLNLGFGLGAHMPISDEYKSVSKAFIDFSLLGNLQFAETTGLTFNVELSAPSTDSGTVWGVLVGVEQQFLPSMVTPFIEGMAGVRYTGYAFEDAFGPALDIGGGILFFRESYVRVRLKGGYGLVFNKYTDQSWSVGMNVLFALSRPGIKTLKL